MSCLITALEWYYVNCRSVIISWEYSVYLLFSLHCRVHLAHAEVQWLCLARLYQWPTQANLAKLLHHAAVTTFLCFQTKHPHLHEYDLSSRNLVVSACVHVCIILYIHVYKQHMTDINMQVHVLDIVPKRQYII